MSNRNTTLPIAALSPATAVLHCKQRPRNGVLVFEALRAFAARVRELKRTEIVGVFRAVGESMSDKRDWDVNLCYES